MIDIEKIIKAGVNRKTAKNVVEMLKEIYADGCIIYKMRSGEICIEPTLEKLMCLGIPRVIVISDGEEKLVRGEDALAYLDRVDEERATQIYCR